MISLKSTGWAAILVFALALLATDTARAQLNAAAYQRRLANLQPRQPGVSPYLNLVTQTTIDQDGNPNNDGVYHTLVRPQVQAKHDLSYHQRQISQLQSQVSSIQANVTAPAARPSYTGHASRFMSYSHYYPQYGVPNRR